MLGPAWVRGPWTFEFFPALGASDVEEIGARNVFPETLNPGRRVRRLAGLQLP